jgi:hypothetical protein
MFNFRIAANLARTALNKDETAEQPLLKKAAEFQAIFSSGAIPDAGFALTPEMYVYLETGGSNAASGCR